MLTNSTLCTHIHTAGSGAASVGARARPPYPCLVCIQHARITSLVLTLGLWELRPWSTFPPSGLGWWLSARPACCMQCPDQLQDNSPQDNSPDTICVSVVLLLRDQGRPWDRGIVRSSGCRACGVHQHASGFLCWATVLVGVYLRVCGVGTIFPGLGRA